MLPRNRLRTMLLLFAGLLFSVSGISQQTITGIVTSQDNEPLIGANVIVRGSTIGTVTDVDGRYNLEVPAENSGVLVASYTGYNTLEVPINNRTVIDIQLSEGVMLEEAVVTALGISREKKSLGYSTQEVDGENLTINKTDNFVNALSGQASGIQIKRTTNMGGSTNVVIRGNTSLQGNNQALFVIDGVPINNTNTNTRNQEQAGGGYDFGNAASDINPQDIESVNILKGAAATALYGSRAANGVVMITTKSGSRKDGIGVTVNSSYTMGLVDRSTFPKYQNQYGAGYGSYYDGPGSFWLLDDVNGDGTDDLVVPLSEDAAYGAPFDENLMVYHWDAFDPESPNYQQAKPWAAAEHGPIDFMENAGTWVNTVSFDKSGDAGDFRFSYTNYQQDGILPNSNLERNNFSLKTSLNLSDRLKVGGFGNFIKTDGLGRNLTGYGGSEMGSFRQWWQTNVDIEEQKDAYFSTRRNLTWNYNGPNDLTPIYWDNPYWSRYENYQSDERNRFIGYVDVSFQLTDWLEIYGRVAADTYGELQEERKAIGSVAGEFGIGTDRVDGSIGQLDVSSGYARRDITNSEFNYDLMLNFNKYFGENWNLSGVIGTNIRRSYFNSIFSATNGGLNIPRLYALQNTVSPLPNPIERDEAIGVNGLYASASLGYGGFLYLEGSLRRDRSSTLPEENSIYYYPSVATSFVFSNLMNSRTISFGKFRLNYAEVGNAPGFNRITDNYVVNTAFHSASSALHQTKNNPELLPERTKSWEAGLEMAFFTNRLGFDLAVYKTNSVDQILPVRVTEATGYLYKVLNAGEIENKGIELSLFGSPVRTSNFNWDINLNWTLNRNQVVSLEEGLDNLQLGSFQGGVTINAKIGEPYGAIFGTDYTYLDERRVVDASNGQYIKTSNSDNVIGNANPDWMAGLNNRISYKNWALSFLIDMQQGGDIFSLDMYYGLATGLYEETAFINDNGVPVRNTLADGGGFINEGVNPDGNENQTRIRADLFGAWGYRRGLPDRAFIYDASYIKLRQLSITYTLPRRLMERSFLSGASISLIGSNLWIIHKNLPHADPESGLGAGNLQGYSTGSLPSTRDIGINVNLQF